MPLVSIVIISHPPELYLEDALISVLNQDFDDYEVLVVDSGEGEGDCRDITKRSRLNTEKKIRYFPRQNSGPSTARNLGLKEARGEFVAFLDGDDLFKKYKISIQGTIFNELANNYACVGGGIVHFSDKTLSRSRGKQPSPVEGNVYRKILEEQIFIPGNVSAYLFRRKPLLEIGGFDNELWYNEDIDLLIRLARQYKLKTHRDLVSMRRIRTGSLSNTNPRTVLDHSIEFAEKLRENDPEIPIAIENRWKQKAYFKAARVYFYQGRFKEFSHLMRKGINEFGFPRYWKEVVGVVMAYSGFVGQALLKLYRGLIALNRNSS